MNVRLSGIGPLTLRRGSTDFAVVRQTFSHKQYDLSGFPDHHAAVERRYRSILSGGCTPVIIDAGANVGTASVWFSDRYPEAVVVAVEPDADNARVCRANTGGRPVRLLEAALGGEPGFAVVHGTDNGEWARRTERDDAGVEIVSVSDAAQRAGVANPVLFVVKMDIEGFESDVFEGETAWPTDVDVLFVELHDWAFPGEGTSDSFRRSTSDLQVDLLMVGENLVLVRRALLDCA